MNITILGTGYVGLTTGVCLAYIGHRVTCMDIDEAKVVGLRRGIVPIYESGLPEMLALSRDRIRFTSSLEEAAREADAVLLAVGTPPGADGAPNLTFLMSAAERLIALLRDKPTPTVIVNKSTAPVGTCARLAAMVSGNGLSARVAVASNPEFLRQGRAVADTLYPERIVAGGSPAGLETLRHMYRPLLEQNFEPPDFLPRPSGKAAVPFIATGAGSAELGKYAANAFLAMKISFINEIANLCDRTGADVEAVSAIIGSDARIGPAFLQAGIGYGGSCFPKDTRALHHIADTSGYDFKLLAAVIEVNREQKRVMLGKLRRELPDLRKRKIAVLGLSFKPGTDDMREAPSLGIVAELVAEGAEVRAHDPAAMAKAAELLPAGVRFAPTAAEALRGADAALLLTEWPEYAVLDALTIRGLMKRPLLIDGRNAMPASARSGLEYRGIGIPEPEGLSV